MNKCRYCGSTNLVAGTEFLRDYDAIGKDGIWYVCKDCEEGIKTEIKLVETFLDEYYELCIKHRIELLMWNRCDGPKLSQNVSTKDWEKSLWQAMKEIKHGTFKNLKVRKCLETENSVGQEQEKSK